MALPHSGEVVDLTDAAACANALDELRRMEAQIGEAKRALSSAIVDASKILGTKSIKLDGGRTATITGGPVPHYDAEAIERDLRVLGMPENRIREIVKEEVTYTVRAVEAKRAAGANPEYAKVIEQATSTVERPYSVGIRRSV